MKSVNNFFCISSFLKHYKLHYTNTTWFIEGKQGNLFSRGKIDALFPQSNINHVVFVLLHLIHIYKLNGPITLELKNLA